MAVLWPDKEAQQILKKHGADPDATYVFETGFGPSGKPHFGTFGEVVRTNYVMLAMRDLGYKTRLIAFSDDLDGLRKVPEGFPVWLREHVGRPVSQIPDPFGDCHESFAGHMNALLVEMLEGLNLDFEFRSSAECYRSGVFNEQITTVIQNYEAVQEIILPTLREQTRENWFPFFPICEGCGSIGHTRVTGVDKDNLLLDYICDRNFGDRDGCGHKGQVSPLDGRGKLQWKVDWPARWHAFGVNYEMFGKDLIESAEVGDRIVQRVFKGKPPVHLFYEHFLAKDGTKISKSKGTGMTAEEWLRYGTYDSLMMLMLDKPGEAKRLFPGVVPRYMDMVAKAAQAYYASGEKNEAQEREARVYNYLHLFSAPTAAPPDVDFGTLSNLVGNVGMSDPALVEEYLVRSGLILGSLSDEQRQALHDLIKKAMLYYNEQMSLDLVAPQLDAQDGLLLGQLVAYLESAEYDADTIHNELFQLPRRHEVEPSKFFRAVYNALIKQERGPRGGQFIKLLGQDTAAKLIRERVTESIAGQDQTAEQDSPASFATIPVGLAQEVRQQYPGICVGAALISNVSVVAERPKELSERIAEAVAAVGKRDFETAISTGPIGAYRALYETFGANPNATAPSSEAILRLATKDGRLPEVNNLVDTVNLSVLTTGISAAVYDIDALELPLVLRFARDGDKHQALGAKNLEDVEKGELVYADGVEVICRSLNYRDSDKTKVIRKTQNVLLILDGSPGIAAADVLEALHTTVENIVRYSSGQVEVQALLA